MSAVVQSRFDVLPGRRVRVTFPCGADPAICRGHAAPFTFEFHVPAGVYRGVIQVIEYRRDRTIQRGVLTHGLD